LSHRTVRSERYLLDIDLLAFYGIESFGEERASRFLEDLKSLEGMIASFPLIGESFARDLRRIVVQSYWLYYRVTNEQVVFLRIIRTETDPPEDVGA
jgi:plasmid stabilization system protein ParE